MSDLLKLAFEHCETPRLPRGELWIGTGVFAERRAEDSVQAHLELCREAGMDFVSLPVDIDPTHDPGYRLFAPADIAVAAGGDLPVVAVVSGPFQRIVDRRGLRAALADVAKDVDAASENVEREAVQVESLVKLCVGQGAAAIVVAEDLAHGTGTFFSPAIFNKVMCPCHVRLVEQIHRSSACAVLHSCGNITSLIPDIVSSGFDGLSCEQDAVDVLSLKQDHGPALTILAGLGSEDLYPESLPAEGRRRFIETALGLGRGGGFILSSSSGLHSAHELRNVRKLYELADRAWRSRAGAD